MSNRPTAVRPSRRNRRSSSEWSRSGPSRPRGSSNTAAASSKLTPCLMALAAAFRASHSNIVQYIRNRTALLQDVDPEIHRRPSGANPGVCVGADDGSRSARGPQANGSARRNDDEPVGLLEVGRDLGDQLVGPDPHRGGQPFLPHDLRLEASARTRPPPPGSRECRVIFTRFPDHPPAPFLELRIYRNEMLQAFRLL